MLEAARGETARWEAAEWEAAEGHGHSGKLLLLDESLGIGELNFVVVSLIAVKSIFWWCILCVTFD